MALGLFVDLAELEGWKARARQIVCNSRNPGRSLQLMRDKAASLFNFPELRAATKVNSKVEGWVSPCQTNKGDPLAVSAEKGRRPESWSGILPPLSMVGHDQGLAPVQDETHLIEIKTESGMQARVAESAGFATVVSMAARPCLRCDLENPGRTDDVLSTGRSLLRADEEPPDPGKLLTVVYAVPVQERKNEVGIYMLHSYRHRKHGGTVNTMDISSNKGNKDVVMYTSRPAVDLVLSKGSATVKNEQSREPGSNNPLVVYTTKIQAKGEHPSSQNEETNDELKDTGTSPKNPLGTEIMDLDKSSRKCLNMADGSLGLDGLPNSVLAITEGKGDDLADDLSPSSSLDSKRARKDNNANEGDRRSAGFPEEYRREQ